MAKQPNSGIEQGKNNMDKARKRKRSVIFSKVLIGDDMVSICSLPGLDDVFTRMEESLSSSGERRQRKSVTWSQGGKYLESFRNLVRTVMLLLRCFKTRKKISVDFGEPSYLHHNSWVPASIKERSSLNWEMQMILFTPPELRLEEDVKKVASYLRVRGVIRAMMGQTSITDDEDFARYVAYERYESGRIIAQQDRPQERFYYFLRGKVLKVKDYHVGNSVISKTMSVFTKGQTTSAEEMNSETVRKENLVCRDTVEVFVLDKDDYFTLCKNRSGGAKEYLSKHRFLRMFPQIFLQDDGNQLQIKYYPKGDVIYHGNKKSDWIYVVKSGECAIVRTQSVANVMEKKKALFNKQNVHELGCDHKARPTTPLAGFRMWSAGKSNTNFPSHMLASRDSNSISHTPLPSVFQRTSIAQKENRSQKTRLENISTKSVNSSIKSFQGLKNPNWGSKSFSNSLAQRKAHLELGRLKEGSIFGLGNYFGAEEENIGSLSLLSNGSDIIMIGKRFFFRHAPANLLIQLSGVSHDIPTIHEARATLETAETWNLYKSNLMRMLTSRKRVVQTTTSSNNPHKSRSYSPKRPVTVHTTDLRNISARKIASAPSALRSNTASRKTRY